MGAYKQEHLVHSITGVSGLHTKWGFVNTLEFKYFFSGKLH